MYMLCSQQEQCNSTETAVGEKADLNCKQVTVNPF